jgi:hypothetical protein
VSEQRDIKPTVGFLTDVPDKKVNSTVFRVEGFWTWRVVYQITRWILSQENRFHFETRTFESHLKFNACAEPSNVFEGVFPDGMSFTLFFPFWIRLPAPRS